MARELEVIDTVKKFCKGYLSRKEVGPDRQYQKMHIHFKYFEDWKEDMELKAARVCLYHIKKHFNKMREKRAKEAQKKALNAGKKGKGKGKKGPAKASPAPAPAKPVPKPPA